MKTRLVLILSAVWGVCMVTPPIQAQTDAPARQEGQGASPLRVPAMIPGVTNLWQAHTDYMLNCQGCHRPDGTGDERSAPPLRGWVARFLSVPGGREFLGRVPGVATAALEDARLANLVNWMLVTFDPHHMPADFHPYDAAEIGRLRHNPLRLERAEERARLMENLRNN